MVTQLCIISSLAEGDEQPDRLNSQTSMECWYACAASVNEPLARVQAGQAPSRKYMT